MTTYNLTTNADTYNGGSSADLFTGPAGGNDVLHGNGGNDTFEFENGQTGLADGGSGTDTLHMVGNGYVGLDPELKISGIENLVVDSSMVDGTIAQLGGFKSIHDNGNSDTFRVFLYGKGGALDFSSSFAQTEILSVDASLTKSAVRITGSNHNDQIEGSDFADTLFGVKGNDTLRGGAGNDMINGGFGKDHLYGDDGKDIFAFNTKLGPSNVDHIGDFRWQDDSIMLKRSIFSWSGEKSGEIKASEFKVIGDGQKIDANDHIIYNHDNGKLYYDVDGKGGHAMVQFAVLDNFSGDVPTLTHHDIILA